MADKHDQDLLAKLAAQIASGIIARSSNTNTTPTEDVVVKPAIAMAKAILEEARKS
jgi:hypothetical protein